MPRQQILFENGVFRIEYDPANERWTFWSFDHPMAVVLNRYQTAVVVTALLSTFNVTVT